MSGRPVRRRVLADVARTGGWQSVLARITSGEKIAAIARSFGVTPGFFSGLLHEAPDRHELVAEARRRASGREPLAEIAALLGGPCLDLGHKTKRYLVRDVEAWLEERRRVRRRAA